MSPATGINNHFFIFIFGHPTARIARTAVSFPIYAASSQHSHSILNSLSTANGAISLGMLSNELWSILKTFELFAVAIDRFGDIGNEFPSSLCLGSEMGLSGSHVSM